MTRAPDEPEAQMQDHAEAGVDGSYQVDVMVTLFAVLLVVLVLTLTATSVSEGERSLWDYRVPDEKSEPFGLRTAAAPYRFRSVWIFREGEALMLDTAALADVVAAAGPTQNFIPAPPGVDVKIVQTAESWNDYVMTLRIYERPVDSPLVSQTIPLADVEALVDAIRLTAEDGVFIYVWNDMQAPAITVEQALRAAGVPFESVDLPESGPNARTVELRRDGAAAGLAGMQRSY